MSSQTLAQDASTPNQALKRGFVFLLIGLQVLLAVVVIVGTLQYVHMRRENALNERLNDAVRNVQGVEEHLTQTLYLVGLTLANLQELSGYQPGQTAREAQVRLERIQRQMPVLRSLSLADRQGRIVASSVSGNLGRKIDLDALLPQAPGERTGLLRLGAPWEGRDFADGRPALPAQPAGVQSAVFFPLALELPGAAGLVAVAAMNTDFFLNRIVGSFDSTLLHVSVFNYNGILLFGNEDALAPGSHVVEPTLLGRIKHEEIGQQRTTQMHGGAALLAYRASRNYPLIVVGHAHHQQILAQWHSDSLTKLSLAGVSLLATLLITGVLTQRLLIALKRESGLHEAQRQAARVFENSNDGIIITAPDTTILAVNPAFERISGYRSAEAVGRTPRLLSSGQQPPDFYARMWSALNEHDEWRGEIVNRRKDGGLMTEWLTITRMHDTLGNTSGYLGFFLDLSELRRSEQLIRQLSTAVEQSPSSVFITNLDGDIEYANPQFTRATGYTLAESLGQNPRFLHSQLTPPDTYRDLWRRLAAGEAWEGEFINRRKDGTVYYDDAKVAPIRDGSGRITHYLAVQHDITARKLAEGALIEAKDAAEAASRAKTIFLANMSHELRTPMNGVMGMIDMVLRRATDPKQIDWLNKSKGSAQRMINVVNDIINFSKAEADRLPLEEKNFSMSQMIDDVMAMQDITVQAKDLNLIRQIPATFPDQLSGDPFHLRQILLNFLGNAIKFSDHGTITLRVSASEQDDDSVLARFEVEDQGIGISPEQQTVLFQAFTQVDGSMTRKYGGSGLGLIISKRLANLMGGDVGVVSQEGRGSTFWATVQLKLVKTSDTMI